MNYFTVYFIIGAIVGFVPMLLTFDLGNGRSVLNEIALAFVVYLIMIVTWPMFVANWVGTFLLRLKGKV